MNFISYQWDLYELEQDSDGEPVIVSRHHMDSAQAMLEASRTYATPLMALVRIDRSQGYPQRSVAYVKEGYLPYVTKDHNYKTIALTPMSHLAEWEATVALDALITPFVQYLDTHLRITE